jgi:hypothetical protein
VRTGHQASGQQHRTGEALFAVAFDAGQLVVPELLVERSVVRDKRGQTDELGNFVHDPFGRGAVRSMLLLMPVSDSMNDGMRTPAFIRL